MLVVNLFAGAGAGKSTTATGVFHALKKQDINCELVTEYAKDLVWSESFKELDDQLKVFAEQNHRLHRLRDKVDVVITDSPLLLSIIYNSSYPYLFEEFVREVFDSYTNLNYYLKRTKKYNPIGRMQTEQEAIAKDVEVKALLDVEKIDHKLIVYDEHTVENITNQIIWRIQK